MVERAAKQSSSEAAADKIRMLASLTLVFSLAGYLGACFWLLELTAHFKLQYLVISVLLLLILLPLRDRRGVLVSLACVVINSYAVLPWYAGRPVRSSALQTSKLRLLLSIVLTSNRNSPTLIRLVDREKPDLLIVEEIDPRWMDELRPLGITLPYAEWVPRRDNFGIAVLSRLPLAHAEKLMLGRGGVPSLLVEVRLDGRTVSVLATHPLPPGGRRTFEERNSQLSAVAGLARRHSPPFVLIGDLNTTMWSPYYARLVRSSGLVDARRGHGLLPTWPADLLLLRIPLDHCLVSPDISVLQIRTGSWIGSDHLPLIVDLAIPGELGK